MIVNGNCHRTTKCQRLSVMDLLIFDTSFPAKRNFESAFVENALFLFVRRREGFWLSGGPWPASPKGVSQ